MLSSFRQRTIRELQVGQTFFKDEQGRWVIRHGPGHYKTGKAYGERPPMVVAPHIYPELEAFLEEWRVELHPEHDFVFSQADGQPLTAAAVYKLFTTSCYRYSPRMLPQEGPTLPSPSPCPLPPPSRLTATLACLHTTADVSFLSQQVCSMHVWKAYALQ